MMGLLRVSAASVLFPVLAFRMLVLFDSQGLLPGLIGFPLIVIPTVFLWHSAGKAWQAVLVANEVKIFVVMLYGAACLSVFDLAYSFAVLPRILVGSHFIPPGLWLLMYGTTSAALMASLKRMGEEPPWWMAPVLYLVVMGTFTLYNPGGLAFSG